MNNGIDLATQLNNQAAAAVGQQAMRQVEVPESLELPLTLNIKELSLIMQALGGQPFQVVAPLMNRLQAQLNLGVSHYINPPVKVDPVVIKAEDVWPHEWFQVSHNVGAHAALAEAEAHRRGSDGLNPDNGTLDVSPTKSPDDDYAAATTFISHACHHLDEGLPNGQRARVSAAYVALRYGCWKLGQFLDERLARPVRKEPS